jgi:hypothetical protein
MDLNLVPYDTELEKSSGEQCVCLCDTYQMRFSCVILQALLLMHKSVKSIPFVFNFIYLFIYLFFICGTR